MKTNYGDAKKAYPCLSKDSETDNTGTVSLRNRRRGMQAKRIFERRGRVLELN